MRHDGKRVRNWTGTYCHLEWIGTKKEGLFRLSSHPLVISSQNYSCYSRHILVHCSRNEADCSLLTTRIMFSAHDTHHAVCSRNELLVLFYISTSHGGGKLEENQSCFVKKQWAEIRKQSLKHLRCFVRKRIRRESEWDKMRTGSEEERRKKREGHIG